MTKITDLFEAAFPSIFRKAIVFDTAATPLPSNVYLLSDYRKVAFPIVESPVSKTEPGPLLRLVPGSY